MSKLFIERRVILDGLVDLVNEKGIGEVIIEGYSSSKTKDCVIRFFSKDNGKRIISVNTDVINKAIKLFRTMLEKDFPMSNPDNGRDRILNITFGDIIIELYLNLGNTDETLIFHIQHAKDKENFDGYSVLVCSVENVLAILGGDNYGI